VKKQKKRIIDNRTILDEFVESFCKIIDKYVRYFICSGFVAIAHGRTRGTEDIDMIIEKIPKKTFMDVHKSLVKNGFICVQSDDPDEIYNTYLEKGDSIRYVWNEEGFFPPEMEIKFAKDELDIEQLKLRIKLPLTKLDVYFSPIDYQIAFKEEWLRSDKDLEDAKHLRIIYEELINEEKINKIKERIKNLRLK
jgi:hypothetical protein